MFYIVIVTSGKLLYDEPLSNKLMLILMIRIGIIHFLTDERCKSTCCNATLAEQKTRANREICRKFDVVKTKKECSKREVPKQSGKLRWEVLFKDHAHIIFIRTKI